jgi:putative phage-type endonuclease
MPAQINLEQNTEQWMDHRRAHANASSAAIIMGCHPFKPDTWDSLLDFYRGKGIPFQENPATRHGHAWEDRALAVAQKTFSEIYSPIVMTEMVDGIPFSASLDGQSHSFDDEETHNLEIKCPMQQKKSKTWKLTESGEVPENYFWQMQQQMLCSGATTTKLFVYASDHDEHVTLEVARCDKSIAELIEQWKLFWALLKSGAMKGDGVLERDDAEFKDAADVWKSANAIYTNAKAELDRAREDLITLAEAQDSEGFGVKVIKVERAGSVQYKKIPVLDGIDLESFRSKGSISYRITGST